MNNSNKTKGQNNKKSKLSQKSKTRKNMSGGSIFSPNPAIFKNLVYPKSNSGFAGIPELQCTVCKKNIFKMRTMKIANWKKAVFFYDMFDNRFRFFTCTNCGKIDIFSGRINVQQIDIAKK